MVSRELLNLLNKAKQDVKNKEKTRNLYKI